MSITTPPEKAIKKPSRSTPDSPLAQLAEELLFTPNRAQRAIKARFWTLLAGSFSSRNPHEMTQMEIARTVRDNRVLNWFLIPGFQDWFMNSTEHIERLEYLFDLALSAAEDILLSDDPKTASAKVNMIRVVAELAKKMPQRGVEQFQDEKISKMSKAELEAFLDSQGVKVRHETVLSVPATRFEPEVLEDIVDET